MIILYKDPNGDGLKDTGSSSSQRRSSELKIKPDASELEEKVAFLERKLSEQENTINKMKNDLQTEKNREVK